MITLKDLEFDAEKRNKSFDELKADAQEFGFVLLAVDGGYRLECPDIQGCMPSTFATRAEVGACLEGLRGAVRWMGQRN